MNENDALGRRCDKYSPHTRLSILELPLSELPLAAQSQSARALPTTATPSKRSPPPPIEWTAHKPKIESFSHQFLNLSPPESSHNPYIDVGERMERYVKIVCCLF